jgi:hypothetical protein
MRWPGSALRTACDGDCVQNPCGLSPSAPAFLDPQRALAKICSGAHGLSRRPHLREALVWKTPERHDWDAWRAPAEVRPPHTICDGGSVRASEVLDERCLDAYFGCTWGSSLGSCSGHAALSQHRRAALCKAAVACAPWTPLEDLEKQDKETVAR